MTLLLMMLRSVRPSRLDDMPAVAKPFWIRKGYDAMVFFGHIITHTKEEAAALQHFGPLKNHELIHLYQARSCHNSWLLFYLRYTFYWIQASCYRRHLRNAGYRLNPFEMEAYSHMYDLNYLDDKASGTNEWRTFARLSLAERLLKIRQGKCE